MSAHRTWDSRPVCCGGGSHSASLGLTCIQTFSRQPADGTPSEPPLKRRTRHKVVIRTRRVRAFSVVPKVANLHSPPRLVIRVLGPGVHQPSDDSLSPCRWTERKWNVEWAYISFRLVQRSNGMIPFVALRGAQRAHLYALPLLVDESPKHRKLQ